MLINIKIVTIIGIGLIGSSILRAINECITEKLYIKVYDKNLNNSKYVLEEKLADEICETVESSVLDSDLVILAIPVGAMLEVGKLIKKNLKKGSMITDTGSTKISVINDLSPYIPENVFFIPSHPLAGTEHSGPRYGFASLFRNRYWIIIGDKKNKQCKTLSYLFEKFGSKVEFMSASYHDRILAITSHLPHLIAYSIVDTASNLEQDLKDDIIRFSATGFRDFTRLASSDPIMWRDVFLKNSTSVLEMLQRFNEDLTALQKLIRNKDSKQLFEFFKKTKMIRSKIIEANQHVPEEFKS